MRADARLEKLAELVTTKEAADMAGVGERTWWGWSRSGVAPAPLKVGGAVRYSRSAILKWIEAGCPRVDGGQTQ